MRQRTSSKPSRVPVPMRRLFVSLVLLAGSTAWAEDFSLQEIMSTRAIAMGGAFRGTGLGADSVYGNPAAMALDKKYQTEVSGGYNIPAKDGYAATALRDSASTDLAAGVGYTFLARGGEAARNWGNLTTVAAALPIANFLFLGASGKYMNQTGAHAINAITMDAGALIRPFGGFILGVGAHNIIDTGHAELARYYSASAAYVAPSFTVAADLRTTLMAENGKPNLNVGAEYTIADLISLRAGYQHDFQLNTNFLGVGAGFTFQGGGVDAAYRHEFGNENARIIAVTLRLSI